MLREFQAIYRQREASGYSEPKTLKFEFDGALPAARGHIEHTLDKPEFVVLTVTELRPLVDWEKLVWLDLDHAGAYCGLRGATFSKRKGDGRTPWFDFSSGMVHRDVLDAHIRATANEPARKLMGNDAESSESAGKK